MRRLNLMRVGRALLARRRVRWIDEARFCDSCSKVDDVLTAVAEQRQRSFNFYVGHAPRSFG